MSWRVGFPPEFSFLDDEHDEIVRALDALKETPGEGPERDFRPVTTGILHKLKLHAQHEEDVMEKLEYPDRDLHVRYHEALIDTVALILEFFDRRSGTHHRERIRKHIEEKLSDEIFVDSLLSEFLGGSASDQEPAPLSATNLG